MKIDIWKVSKITIELPYPLLKLLQGMMIGSLVKDLTENHPASEDDVKNMIHCFQKNLLEIESAMLNYISKDEIRELRIQVAELIDIPFDELKALIKNAIDDL